MRNPSWKKEEEVSKRGERGGFQRLRERKRRSPGVEKEEEEEFKDEFKDEGKQN